MRTVVTFINQDVVVACAITTVEALQLLKQVIFVNELDCLMSDEKRAVGPVEGNTKFPLLLG